jgi:hypothetical protein
MKKSLKRLVIDSATKYLYIALFDQEELIGKFYEAGHNDHSVKLMSELENLFTSNNLIINVNNIIVTPKLCTKPFKNFKASTIPFINQPNIIYFLPNFYLSGS